MSSSWTNHNMKHVLLFFNSELKAYYEKQETGSNPFQCRLLVLIHQAGIIIISLFKVDKKKKKKS